MNPGRPIYFSDFSTAQPASGVSDKPRHEAWQLVDYETEEGLQGKMLCGLVEDQAPEVTIAPGVVGRYAVFVRINFLRNLYGNSERHNGLRLRAASGPPGRLLPRQHPFQPAPPESAAAAVGFRKRDLIHSVDGEPVKTLGDWRVARERGAGQPQNVGEAAPDLRHDPARRACHRDDLVEARGGEP